MAYLKANKIDNASSNVCTGTFTIPSNTTTTVTVNFTTPCNRFMAITGNVASGSYRQPTKRITVPATQWTNYDYPFMMWAASGAVDTSGAVFASDNMSISLTQPRNYYAGDYIYIAFWE